jgi:predicted XRE-type DNA-binding protein
VAFVAAAAESHFGILQPWVYSALIDKSCQVFGIAKVTTFLSSEAAAAEEEMSFLPPARITTGCANIATKTRAV